ncbi:MAG TPA: GNAT family N-acetyltransferase [Nocardioides sp.]|uniref:GNAT family N-acetyltransferase n=1 Tax=Nocardioides sp. TaxID=35761 RepID=UPI002D807EB7|nr:GNAT family N-acetyltransferase [Nocardioides sp.]HET6652151.1 GNAT family N-acetyltransferase [Nocardioides sp.]
MRAVPEWLAERAVRLPGQRHPEPESVPTLPHGIRPRRPKDLPACARLLRVVATEHQYPARWPEAPRSWLAGPDVLSAYVAEEHGEILGHVAIATVPRNGISRVRWQEITGRDVTQLRRISRLFVRRRVRGEGIASDLLDVAVDEIRTHGLVPVLDVVSTSTDGIAFVEKRGWKLLAMDPWGSKTEHLRMHYYAAPPAPLGPARP